MRDEARAWWPVAGWVALIGVATSVPLPVALLPRTGLPLDRVGHLVLYFGLGWLVGRALWTSDRWSVGNLVVAAVAAVLLAVVDEWHQRWVPRREPSLSDWLADVAGVSLGLALYVWTRWQDWQRQGGAARPPLPEERLALRTEPDGTPIAAEPDLEWDDTGA